MPKIQLNKFFNDDQAAAEDGQIFQSGKERNRWHELKLLESAGEISDLQRGFPFTLQEAFKDEWGEHHRAITYTPDFVYYEGLQQIVEDVKGQSEATYRRKKWTGRTEVFNIKRKLFIKRYPHILFRIT